MPEREVTLKGTAIGMNSVEWVVGGGTSWFPVAIPSSVEVMVTIRWTEPKREIRVGDRVRVRERGMAASVLAIHEDCAWICWDDDKAHQILTLDLLEVIE